MLDAYFDAFEDFLRTGDRSRIEAFIDAESNVAALSVYRNGYLKTCRDVLASSFPVVRILVGDDYFSALARAYVEAHPPALGTLIGYGGQFPGFLRSRTDERGLPYLPDVAAIDAAWLSSFFAADRAALSAAEVEAIAGNGGDLSALRVALTPQTTLVRLQYDVVTTWMQIREQGELRSRLRLTRGDYRAMLWRLDGRIFIKSLDQGELTLLDALSDGVTLGEAAALATDVDGSFDIASAFAALLENQILRLEASST